MTGLYNEQFVERLAKGVESLLPGWGMSPESDIRLLTLSENATFLVKDPDHSNPIIVRVHRPDYHTEKEILSELHWIQALLDEAIVKAPSPLPLLNGSLIALFDDEGHKRYVVAFEFLPGEEPSAEENGLVAGFEILGAISARLHKHASAWTVPKGFQRKSWTFETTFCENPLWGDWRDAIDLTHEGQAILEQLCTLLEKQLKEYGQGSDRFGLVHADLRLANLLLDDGKLAVIDFDDCGFGWFMYDFASAISFYETEPYIPQLQAAWLKGYRSVSSLSQEHENMVPTFILFRRLLLTAWIASHAETETAKDAGLGEYTQGTVELAKAYLEEYES